MTTLEGNAPVAVLEIRELSLVWKTDSELSSGLTMATRLSSSLIAIVLARDARTENTAGGGGGAGSPGSGAGSPGGGVTVGESTPQAPALTASAVQVTRVSFL